MNWKDLITRSVGWALSVSIVILSGIMVMYGTLSIATGVFRGIISYIVLGLMLLIAGLTMIHFMGTISGYDTDSNVNDKDKDIEA